MQNAQEATHTTQDDQKTTAPAENKPISKAKRTMMFDISELEQGSSEPIQVAASKRPAEVKRGNLTRAPKRPQPRVEEEASAPTQKAPNYMRFFLAITLVASAVFLGGLLVHL